MILSKHLVVFILHTVSHGYVLHQQERLEGKEKGEAEKDSAPQVPRKDLEMAEKVSKYNVSGLASLLLSPKCLHFTDAHSEVKCLYLLTVIRRLNVQSR